MEEGAGISLFVLVVLLYFGLFILLFGGVFTDMLTWQVDKTMDRYESIYEAQSNPLNTPTDEGSIP